MLGHYLQDETEEGADLGGTADQEAEKEDGGEEEGPEEDQEEGDGEVIVTLGDEPVSEPDPEEKAAPQWVKDLRKKSREDAKRIRELEQQVSAAKAPAAKAPEVGAKPTLEGCDYDADKFEADLIAWQDRKRQADQAANDQRRHEEEAQQAWQDRLNNYSAQKGKLKLPDYEDAELAIQEALNVTQQGIIISGADNPALVVYALGKNPAKAKELADIKDPVKFAFAVAKLETQVKMQKKDKPAPERTVSGTAPKSGAIDSTLDRLRADAEKSGDYSKVHAYKRQQKAKA